MSHWADEAVFYHLYPLATCGAPLRNDPALPPVPRLLELIPWIRHARELGASALLLGPVLESTSHGYDTVDYFRVDRRLGTDDDLRGVVEEAHALGLHVILDAVLGHVGRAFWAFDDVRTRGPGSAYCSWFRGLDFGKESKFGDRPAYEHWKDAPELPRLNLGCAAVREHLLAAVDHWVERYGFDGLRLDSADWLEDGFLAELRAHCDGKGRDLWLLGEVVHGDYGRWANPHALHSVTNYEAFKGLWSSHVDRNFFEIAYALSRQFGPQGIYQGLPLYNFADNHDVNRIASTVRDRAHLFSLYCLLLTMPGVPSLYSGSEWGIAGTRTPTDDHALRPHLDLAAMQRGPEGQDLHGALQRLIAVRRASEALLRGGYRQLAVASEQIAFLRQSSTETVLVVVNAGQESTLTLALPDLREARLVDLLEPPQVLEAVGGSVRVTVPGTWARVLRVEARDGVHPTPLGQKGMQS